MNYCKKCGFESQSLEAKFCPICGEAIQRMSPSLVHQQQENSPCQQKGQPVHSSMAYQQQGDTPTAELQHPNPQSFQQQGQFAHPSVANQQQMSSPAGSGEPPHQQHAAPQTTGLNAPVKSMSLKVLLAILGGFLILTIGVVLLLTRGLPGGDTNGETEEANGYVTEIEEPEEDAEIEEVEEIEENDESLLPQLEVENRSGGIGFGRMEGNTYINDALGFSIEFPDGWTVASEEEMLQALELGLDFIDNDELTNAFEAGLIDVQPLFVVSETAISQATEGTSNINANAERTILSPEAYLNVAREQLEMIMPEATLSQVNSININGAPFYYIVSEIEMFGMSMRQMLYTTRMGTYLVVFTTTSLQPADDPILREAIMSIVVNGGSGNIHEDTNHSDSNDLSLDDPPERPNQELPSTIPDGTIDERLIGTWEWELGDFVYIFNADGTGTRGFPDMELDFIWRVSGDTLYIEGSIITLESWAVTFEGNALTIVCNNSGATFTYDAR